MTLIFKRIFHSVSCLLFCLSLMGQEIDPASLPDVEDYIVIRSNPMADTIIIALHGGPSDQLYEGSFFFMEQIPTFSVVEVKKHEMLSPVLFDPNLSFEDGEAVNDTTVALIQKVVQHYNDQEKEVVILGQSWGAIIMGEYLDDYGIGHVHRIIPMEGRLSVPLEFVNYLLDGYLPTFDSDGVTLVLDTPQGTWPQSLLNLGAAAFANRWTDSLANMNLSKMMYTWAEGDMQTGALIDEEIDFLNASGAQTLFIPGAGHGASFDVFNQEIILDFIREDIATDIEFDDLAQAKINLYPSLSSDYVNLEFENEVRSLSVLNMSGQVVYHETDIEFPLRLDVSLYNSGQYIAIIQTPKNRMSTARFQVVK